MVTKIMAPKPSCPRNLGTWACESCEAEHDEYYGLIEQTHCGETFRDMTCGITHLGYVWCDDCVGRGRTEQRVSHVGEYLVVGVVKEPLTE